MKGNLILERIGVDRYDILIRISRVILQWVSGNPIEKNEPSDQSPTCAPSSSHSVGTSPIID